MTTLPPVVLARAERCPAEEILLHALRAALPGVHITNRPADGPMPRLSLTDIGVASADSEQREIHTSTLRLTAYAAGPEADSDGYRLADAGRVVIRDACRSNYHAPGLGWARAVRVWSGPMLSRGDERMVPEASRPTSILSSRYEVLLEVTVRSEGA